VLKYILRIQCKEELTVKEFMETREDLISRFSTNPSTGLTAQQSKQNQAEYGRNTLTREEPESLAKRIWGAASEPMIL
jgi:Ca2+-transporting ATPase